MNRIPVGVLGATGSVGEEFVRLLTNHPWFELKAVTASQTSLGGSIGSLLIQETKPDLPCSLVFSALDPISAEKHEAEFVKAGYTVVTNASAYRLTQGIPLIVPEVNGSLLEKTNTSRLIACPNCVAVGLSLALKPLSDAFGLEAIHIVTLQAISGAGKGAKDLPIQDNVIPYIAGEEEKIEKELPKILGISPQISVSCSRVPVSDGHMAFVSVKFKIKATKEQILHAWEAFEGVNLPSAPKKPVTYFEQVDAPQPKVLRDLYNGMGVSVGQLRQCPLFDHKFVVLSHNRIRGAAGGALLVGELLRTVQ
jgi:aspartate-semialdehyde dehydrogenase